MRVVHVCVVGGLCLCLAFCSFATFDFVPMYFKASDAPAPTMPDTVAPQVSLPDDEAARYSIMAEIAVAALLITITTVVIALW